LLKFKITKKNLNIHHFVGKIGNVFFFGVEFHGIYISTLSLIKTISGVYLSDKSKNKSIQKF